MLSYKDVEYKNIVIVSSLKEKSLCWGGGLLVVKDRESGKVLSRLSAHRILLLLIIGNASITTPLLERCKKYQIPLVLSKNNFRTVAFLGNGPEGNCLLRSKQYQHAASVTISRQIIANKIDNQLQLLQQLRPKNESLQNAITQCQNFAANVLHCQNIAEIMGMEGNAAKIFFRTYFNNYNWHGRKPRIKTDYLNVLLDIGYTFLFNYIEIMLRMWGFDLYVGNLHQLWFQRKSLVCDMVEVFRCLIDQQIHRSLAWQQFKADDFSQKNGQCYLRLEHNRKYSETFLQCMQEYKAEIYYYIRDYYRYFMGMKSVATMPKFNYKERR